MTDTENKEQEQTQNGSISVNAENIFPVIKKWLYSDKEIFLRELLSNACDAVTKLKRLSALGQREAAEDETFRCDVVLDREAGTLTVSDNGIGMTKEEVERYICNIALSGAIEFMEKYEKDSAGNGIIGHFGLGFYSAFMVANRVEVRTCSYAGGDTTLWVCSSDGAYHYEDTAPRSSGTDVILHIDEDEGKEFLDENKVREVLEKYCSFMPVEIYFSVAGKEKKEDEEEKPINDVHPLWQKSPTECTDEEYAAFYKKVFNDYKDPLFHIHLNVDYPICFKGILYFPKINPEFERPEGQVKLYYNGVFVADNIKEVIPEYFLLLKGVLDCPELPLNVSRSYLQNSGYVTKIAAHIVKKTADKLKDLFAGERERYEKIWNDLKIFVEYGCLKDEKFYDRVKDVILFETVGGAHKTLEECKSSASGGTLYYCTDKRAQAQYLSLYADRGVEVLFCDRVLDAQFLSFLEHKAGVKFLRVDADPAAALKKEENAAGAAGLTEEQKTALTALFKEATGEQALDVEYAALPDANIPALLKVFEESRRMNDLMKAYGMDAGDLNDRSALLLNEHSELLCKLAASSDEEKKKAAAAQIYGFALLSAGKLDEKSMKELFDAGYKMLGLGL